MKIYTYSIISIAVILLLSVGVWWYMRPQEPLRIMWWSGWAPADIFGEMLKEYSEESGIPIEYVQIPIPEYLAGIEERITGDVPEFDMVIGDSQVLGEMVEKGIYADLTKFVQSHQLVGRIEERIFKRFSEYPQGSERYYSVPALPDALIMAYRRDWFEDVANQKEYQARFGVPLTVPNTWDELERVAAFFTDPARDQYGLAILGGDAYDASIMTYSALLGAYGGAWGDEVRRTTRGYINSQSAVQALITYASLVPYTPTEYHRTGMVWGVGQDEFLRGRIAMAIDFIPPFAKLTKQSTNPLYDYTAYATLPLGPAGRASALGGQALALIEHSRKKKDAYKVLEWWVSPETQDEWTRRSGYPIYREDIASSAFLEYPYASIYGEAMDSTRDFWNVPGYAELIRTANSTIFDAAYTTQSITTELAQKILTGLSETHERILSQ